ncbi:MAG: hypothetical protein AAF004_11980 [Pseudomonadota bacterium]
MKRVAAFSAVLAALTVAGCGSDTTTNASDRSTTDTPSRAASDARSCVTTAETVLRGTLHGAVRGTIAADAGTTECRGMPRPREQGLRLQFRTAGVSRMNLPPLVLILGIDTLGRGDTGSALRTTVTLIDEDQERFFSTGEQQSCFSDVLKHRALEQDAQSVITGTLWCTAAIPQVNGQRSVRISELDFEGVVSWPEPTP